MEWSTEQAHHPREADKNVAVACKRAEMPIDGFAVIGGIRLPKLRDRLWIGKLKHVDTKQFPIGPIFIQLYQKLCTVVVPDWTAVAQNEISHSSSVLRLLDKYCPQGRIDKVTPHQLRHNFASRYLQKNPADLRGLWYLTRTQ